jgi:alanine-synthesizing transaminase
MLIISFPHNPTGEVVELDFFEKVVAFCKENQILLVHDLAYADITFDGYKAPSLLQVKGAKDIGVELFSMSKSYSMAGWRVGFVCGNRDMVNALTRIKSYLDYGMFQPIQIAAIIALNEDQDCVNEIVEVYRDRRDALISGLNRIGWEVPAPKGTMFVWGRNTGTVQAHGFRGIRQNADPGSQGGGKPGPWIRPVRRGLCAHGSGGKQSSDQSGHSRP